MNHCSPISETTILSSTGAACNQYEHFKTQLPYALLNGAIALASFIAAGVLESPVVLIAALATQLSLYLVLSKTKLGQVNQQPVTE